MSKRDYYEVLGLAKNASEDDIRKSYRQMGMKYHPDRNQGERAKDAEEKFKEAKEAYEILSDAKKRAAYDHFGHEGLGTGVDRLPRADTPLTPAPTVKNFVFEDFRVTAAADIQRMNDKKERVADVQKNLRPLYDRVKLAHRVYEDLVDGLQLMANDVGSPYRSISTIKQHIGERIEALQKFADTYQKYQAEKEAELVAKGAEFKKRSDRYIILQRINTESGDVLRAFANNISEVSQQAEQAGDNIGQTILERLSSRNTEIGDLVDRLDAQRPSKLSMLSQVNREKSASIDIRVNTLKDMVYQYRQLAPVLIELGYVGDGYNESGLNGDVQFAVSTILKQIKESSEHLKNKDPDMTSSAAFKPYNIFKHYSLFRPEDNESEINAHLTPEQRKLVTWAQNQIDRFSESGTIDEDTISAALSTSHLEKAQKSFENWAGYVERAVTATDPINVPENIKLHLKTKAKLQAVLDKMNGLFLITDESFLGQSGKFNSHAVVDQSIALATSAKANAIALLNETLLTSDAAASLLRDIDPKFKLAGSLKETEESHNPSALYTDNRMPA